MYNRRSKCIISKTSSVAREPVDLSLELNYGISKLLDQSILNAIGLPVHHCAPSVMPDFIALNTEPGLFHHTKLTAVAFYTFDRSFDNIDGLYNAIYYNQIKLLQIYKVRYANIRFIIAPDYSLFDNVWPLENLSRLLKIRVIMLWFVMEIGAVVIPNAIYLSENSLPIFLSGFENVKTMCFSTKGHVRRARDRQRVKETVKYVVDHFNLDHILVYSVCGNDKTSLRLFDYAVDCGISVSIIDNTMRSRNQQLCKQRVKA